MRQLLAIGGPLAGHKVGISDDHYEHVCLEQVLSPPQKFGRLPDSGGEIRRHFYRRETFVHDGERLELMVHVANPSLDVLKELLAGYERRAKLHAWLKQRQFQPDQLDAIESGKL